MYRKCTVLGSVLSRSSSWGGGLTELNEGYGGGKQVFLECHLVDGRPPLVSNSEFAD